MQNKMGHNDENLRRTIMERVLLGIIFIGVIQSIATIFGHESNLSTLWVIVSLIPLTVFTYFYVKKTGKVVGVGRALIYIALPVLVYRAYTMGGVWGVTINWVYLIPVFGALFLDRKEILSIVVVITLMILALGIAHNHDPKFALDHLLLVPAFARVVYILMPLYVISYVIIFYEAQRKKYLVEIQEQSVKDLQNEKLISIGSMSAGMAHEINNPLMVLQGSVKLIESKLNRILSDEKQEDKEKIAKYIVNLNTGIQRIAKIVSSVKDLSANTEKVPAEKIFLEEAVDDSLTLYKDKLIYHGIRLIKSEQLNNFAVLGVKIQVEQIIMNFISNSIDEIKGKENPWISISAESINNDCFIRVVDSGQGIDSDTVKQLFDPFFTTKEVGAGTGLGLSLSKKLAENNNGEISYELYNGNTSFLLKIPLS